MLLRRYFIMARDAHTRSLPDASNGPTHVHYLVPTLAHSCSLPGTYTSHRCLLQWGTYTGQRDGHYKASTLDRLLLQAWELWASAIGHLRVKSVFSQPVCWQSQAGLYRMVQLVILLQPLSHKYFASQCAIMSCIVNGGGWSTRLGILPTVQATGYN